MTVASTIKVCHLGEIQAILGGRKEMVNFLVVVGTFVVVTASLEEGATALGHGMVMILVGSKLVGGIHAASGVADTTKLVQGNIGFSPHFDC